MPNGETFCASCVDAMTAKMHARYEEGKAGAAARREVIEKQRAIEQRPIQHFPLLSIQAAKRKGARGGYRLWLIARAMDESGRGMLARDDLKAYALQLGLSPRQYDRWIQEARNNDLLTDVQQAQSKGGAWLFIIASLPRAAHALHCENVGTRKATMPAVDVIGAGYRARLFMSYQQTHMQKPITQERIQKIANIPASTQRYRNNQSGVKRVRSYAKTTITKDNLPGLQEHSQHKGLFVRRDGFISWRLPNTYIIDFEGYTTGARGRARKANKQLKGLLRLEGLLIMQQALTSDNEPNEQPKGYRLFNTTDKQFKTTRKKLHDLKPSAGDVYAFPKRARSGALMWEHANAADYATRAEV